MRALEIIKRALLALTLSGLAAIATVSWADSKQGKQGKPSLEKPKVVFDALGVCTFKYVDYYGGYDAERPSRYYTKDPYRPSVDMTFNFGCQEAPDWPAFASEAGAKLDPKSGQWGPDAATLMKWGESFAQLGQFKDYVKSFRYGSLQAVNSSGFYVVNDDITGDESRRIRQFSAYLHYKDHVLSIQGQGGSLAEPKKSLVPLLLRLIQSIEFVDASGQQEHPDVTPAAKASSGLR